MGVGARVFLHSIGEHNYRSAVLNSLLSSKKALFLCESGATAIVTKLWHLHQCMKRAVGSRPMLAFRSGCFLSLLMLKEVYCGACCA